MVENLNTPKSHNCVVDEKAETISFNLHFIKEIMRNWWGNVDIMDTVGNFADRLSYSPDNEINTFEKYIEILENEIILQKTIIKLKTIIGSEITTKVAKRSVKEEPKIVGKIDLLKASKSVETSRAPKWNEEDIF